MSDFKLPRTRSRHHRESLRNEWVDTDDAERRKPIVAAVALGLVLVAGLVLVVLGLKSH